MKMFVLSIIPLYPVWKQQEYSYHVVNSCCTAPLNCMRIAEHKHQQGHMTPFFQTIEPPFLLKKWRFNFLKRWCNHMIIKFFTSGVCLIFRLGGSTHAHTISYCCAAQFSTIVRGLENRGIFVIMWLNRFKKWRRHFWTGGGITISLKRLNIMIMGDSFHSFVRYCILKNQSFFCNSCESISSCSSIYNYVNARHPINNTMIVWFLYNPKAVNYQKLVNWKHLWYLVCFTIYRSYLIW